MPDQYGDHRSGHFNTGYLYYFKKTKPGKGGERQITDALFEQPKQGKVIAYKFSGTCFDCGSVDGFVEATNHFYNLSKS